jgi:hypothetical protein
VGPSSSRASTSRSSLASGSASSAEPAAVRAALYRRMRFPGRGIDECCMRLLLGKSTLALALLRLIPTEGKVFIDGIATDELNLDALRSSITIIPQDPTL